MRFTEVKKDGIIHLAGVDVEIDWKDSSPTAITFKDSEDHIVRVARDQYGQMDILIPARR